MTADSLKVCENVHTFRNSIVGEVLFVFCSDREREIWQAPYANDSMQRCSLVENVFHALSEQASTRIWLSHTKTESYTWKLKISSWIVLTHTHTKFEKLELKKKKKQEEPKKNNCKILFWL